MIQLIKKYKREQTHFTLEHSGLTFEVDYEYPFYKIHIERSEHLQTLIYSTDELKAIAEVIVWVLNNTKN